ncbi:MAG: AAA family ATPase [Rhodanobacteraceae bacterium]|nr:AAA family ATPase [Rhodanobacteraceae bacterium]
MRILAIRLCNLASLGGEHVLDFEAPPLAHAGLYAITGPTGAGKSVLLDALCLALYNDTPRLRAAPARDSQTPDIEHETVPTADPRTLLRRGCGEGWAEVDFRGQDGRRYRSRWSVRRARGRAGGRLQAVEMALTCLDDSHVLASQLKEHRAQLERVLGLSFDQFTRAVLLAQAEFGAFLRASDKERAELLEKLTDSARYARIGARAWQRRSEAKAAYDALQARADGLAPLDAAARAGLEARVEAAQQALVTHERQLRVIDDGLRARDEEAALLAALAQQRAQHAACQAQVDAAAPERERLAQLAAFAPVRERWLRRAELRAELAQDTRAAQADDAALAAAAAALDSARSAEADAHAVLQSAQAARSEAEPALQAAQAAERRVEDWRQRREAAEARLAEVRAAQQQNALRQESLQAALQAHAQALAALDAGVHERAWLQPLRVAWSALQALLDEAHAAHAANAGLRAEAAQAQAGLADASARLARAAEDAGQAQQQLEACVATLATLPDPYDALRASQAALAALDAEEQQWRARAEALQRWREAASALAGARAAHAALAAQQQACADGLPALEQAPRTEAIRLDELRRLLQAQQLARSASVAELRAGLTAGEPCPVCGSEAHPWTRHDTLLAAIAAHDEAELSAVQARADAADAQWRVARERQALLQGELAAAVRATEERERAAERAEASWRALAGGHGDADAEARLAQVQADLQARIAAQRRHDADLGAAANRRRAAEGAVALARERAEQARGTLAQAQAARADAQARAERSEHALAHAATQAQSLRTRLAALLPAAQLDVALAHPARTGATLRAELDALAQIEAQRTERARRETTNLQQARELDVEEERLDQAEVAACGAAETCAGEWQRERDALRTLLAGQPDSEAWRRVLETALTQARVALDAARTSAAAALQALADARESGLRRRARIESQQQELATLEHALAAWTQAHPGLEGDALAQAPADMVEALRAHLAALDGALRDAAVRLQERAARLQAQQQALAGLPARAELQAQRDEFQALREACAGELERARVEREVDDQERARLAGVRTQLAAAQAEYARWGAIAELIGSADGALFRMQAQASHLEQLVAHANHHLQLFARRYRLRRGGSELGLLVIDTEMGDEQRSVHSLSGGESFLVALALALGLASLSSRQLRIESLFIDEGFGALDAHALDLALDALDGLQALGRRVGVISHVPEMHERISTQVRVRRLGQGLSTVEVVGPGGA